MIAAALAALPLIAEAGQGLVKTVAHDVAGFLGIEPQSQTGQNVPAPANSTTLTGAVQGLSSGMLGVLTQVQSELGTVGDFASGQSTISKVQLENEAGVAANELGQDPTKAKAVADKVFDAIDTARTGEISAPQLSTYLGQVQSAATAKYQSAEGLVGGFLHQMGALVTAPLNLLA